METEALIRSALGETDVVTDDIKPLRKLVIRASVLALARILLDWDEAAIDQRIVEGERVAFERGWNPPLTP